jgi:hypothetical protein
MLPSRDASEAFFMKKVRMRLKAQIACALVVCGLAAGLARAESSGSPNLSRSDLNRLVREAHTPEQYMTLASYFRWRQQHFEQQAHDELVFWAERSRNVSLAAAKYPTPLESSKNRYDYFAYEARQMSLKAAHYEGLAASPGR